MYIYRCGYCEKKCTMLSDIKHHVKTEHMQYIERIEVIHVKQSRTDNDVMDEKTTSSKGALPKIKIKKQNWTHRQWGRETEMSINVLGLVFILFIL